MIKNKNYIESVAELKKNWIPTICDDYHAKWDNVHNVNDLLDIFMSIQGIEYACRMYKHGRGLLPTKALSLLGDYVNTGYAHKSEGYTSACYIRHDGHAANNSTVTMIIGSNIVFDTLGLPYRLYLCDGSSVTITGGGNGEVYSYGANDITLSPDTQGSVIEQ